MNWKTTVAGVVGGLVLIIKGLSGYELPPWVTEVIIGVFALVLGVLAKDFNVTGGTVEKK